MIRWLSNYIFISHRNSIITTSDEHTADSVTRFFLAHSHVKMSDCEAQTLMALVEPAKSRRRLFNLPNNRPPGTKKPLVPVTGGGGEDADNLSVLFPFIKTTDLTGESPVARFGDVHLRLVCTCQRHLLSPEKRREWHKWQVQWRKNGSVGVRGGAYHMLATSRPSKVLPIRNMTIVGAPMLGSSN